MSVLSELKMVTKKKKRGFAGGQKGQISPGRYYKTAKRVNLQDQVTKDQHPGPSAVGPYKVCETIRLSFEGFSIIL